MESITAPYITGFKAYLKLEKSLSDNTEKAYLRDLRLFEQYIQAYMPLINDISAIGMQDISSFMQYIGKSEFAPTSQARLLSGLKTFYRFLAIENIITEDPTQLITAPKTERKLPAILSEEEVIKLLESIALDSEEGHRNHAMLEILYSCGLRVSELTELKLSNLFFDVGFIRVTGKGNKERLVPIGDEAVKQTQLYLDHFRSGIIPVRGMEDYVFLSRLRKKLSRITVFNIIKNTARAAGINEAIHPHTLRHCFATHLVERGADLRSVQEMLGHQSITTTEIYTHINDRYLRDTLEKFHPRFQKEVN